MSPDMPSTLPGDPLFGEIIGRVAAAAFDRVDKEWRGMRDDQVPMVGGPKDGETYRWTTATTLVIPDGKERIQKVDADGYAVTIFGQHTYRLNCYARDDQRWYRWDYVGYEPPK